MVDRAACLCGGGLRRGLHLREPGADRTVRASSRAAVAQLAVAPDANRCFTVVREPCFIARGSRR
jgi:hypothetical protein